MNANPLEDLLSLLHGLCLWLPESSLQEIYWDGQDRAPFPGKIHESLAGSACLDFACVAVRAAAPARLAAALKPGGALACIGGFPGCRRQPSRVALWRQGFRHEVTFRFQSRWFELPGLFSTAWLPANTRLAVDHEGRGPAVRRTLDRLHLTRVLAPGSVSLYRRGKNDGAPLAFDLLASSLGSAGAIRPVCILDRSRQGKVIVQMEGPRGQDRSFVKVPVSALGAAKVERNWEALSALHAKLEQTKLRIPRPVMALRAPGGLITLERSLDGSTCGADSFDTPRNAFEEAFRGAGLVTRRAGADLIASFRRLLEPLPHSDEILRRLTRPGGLEAALETGPLHGDLAPRNFRMNPGGRVGLFDWDDFHPSGLFCVNRFDWEFRRLNQMEKVPPIESLLGAAARLRCEGVDASAAFLFWAAWTWEVQPGWRDAVATAIPELLRSRVDD
jgi:hypothetical protein